MRSGTTIQSRKTKKQLHTPNNGGKEKILGGLAMKCTNPYNTKKQRRECAKWLENHETNCFGCQYYKSDVK